MVDFTVKVCIWGVRKWPADSHLRESEKLTPCSPLHWGDSLPVLHSTGGDLPQECGHITTSSPEMRLLASSEFMWFLSGEKSALFIKNTHTRTHKSLYYILMTRVKCTHCRNSNMIHVWWEQWEPSFHQYYSPEVNTVKTLPGFLMGLFYIKTNNNNDNNNKHFFFFFSALYVSSKWKCFPRILTSPPCQRGY